MPAQAGIQLSYRRRVCGAGAMDWIPTFAGMTPD